MDDNQNQGDDTFGVKQAIERMLGRNLSPEASAQLTPYGATTQTADDGAPFYLSNERNPPQDETADSPQTPPILSGKDNSDADEAEPPALEQSDSSESQKAAPKKQLLDFGQSNQNPLAAALAKRDAALNNAKWQRGVEGLSAAIARVPVNNSDSDIARKEANKPVEDYMLKNQEEANDPNSGLSKGLRSYMEGLGMEIPAGATAAQMKSVLPYIFKDTEAKQAQAARHEDMAARNEERKTEAEYRNKALALQREQMHASKDLMRQDKLDKDDTNRLDKLNKMLTAEIASGRSAFGQAAKNYQSIQNAQALLNGEADPNNLDNRQVYELTRVLDRVLSQNGGTMGGAEHLTPDTARGRLAKLMELVTNKRQGAQAGDFVNSFAKTLQRESDIAQKQMMQTQKSLMGSSKDLYDRHPDVFKEMLEQKGIPSNIFEHEKKQHSKEPAEPVVAVDDPKDQAAVQLIMQKNPGISIEEATKALHGYKASKSQGGQ